MKICLGIFFIMVCTVSFGQTQLEEETILKNWLPDVVGEYKPEGEAISRTAQRDEQSYMIASRNYKKNDSRLEVTILDYRKSPKLLEKYTSSWKVQQIDDGKQRVGSLLIDGRDAWASFDKKANAGQLFINEKNKFLIFLSVTGKDTDFLINVARKLDKGNLPD